jgi:hypothetical protein
LSNNHLYAKSLTYIEPKDLENNKLFKASNNRTMEYNEICTLYNNEFTIDSKYKILVSKSFITKEIYNGESETSHYFIFKKNIDGKWKQTAFNIDKPECVYLPENSFVISRDDRNVLVYMLDSSVDKLYHYYGDNSIKVCTLKNNASLFNVIYRLSGVDNDKYTKPDYNLLYYI